MIDSLFELTLDHSALEMGEVYCGGKCYTNMEDLGEGVRIIFRGCAAGFQVKCGIWAQQAVESVPEKLVETIH
jgi:hypothetical protein